MRRRTSVWAALKWAFGDESIRPRSYWLALVVVEGQRKASLGRLVRSLHLPGQRQLHFKSERDRRRRLIIKTVVGSGAVVGWVYRAPRPVVVARDSCLRAAVSDLADGGVRQLVLDHVDEQQAVRDRIVIRESLLKRGSELGYRHGAPWENPGVQVADVIAWAYGAGGDWRRRIQPIVERVVDLGS